MKHFGKMIVGACTVLTLTCTPAQLLAQSLSPSTQWEWNKGTIVIKSPERPAGQESVIGRRTGNAWSGSSGTFYSHCRN